jgi:hypothetical protein
LVAITLLTDQPGEPVELGGQHRGRTDQRPKGGLTDQDLEPPVGVVQKLLPLQPGAYGRLGVPGRTPELCVPVEDVPGVVGRLEDPGDGHRLEAVNGGRALVFGGDRLLYRLMAAGELAPP